MSERGRWAKQSSKPPFFLHHEFLLPFILFAGMLVTDRLETAFNVLGIRVYDPDHIIPLLFYAGIAYIAVSYSFKSFMRWSRFRLSQQYPLINFFLNILLALLPISSIVVSPLFIYPMLVIHWFSHVRSPNADELKPSISTFRRTYLLILMQLFICFVALFIVSFEISNYRDLTLWGWLSYK